MVAPINHDTDSKLATAGWSTAKGAVAGTVGGAAVGTVGGTIAGAIGGLFSVLVPALVIGGAIAAFGALGGGAIGLVMAAGELTLSQVPEVMAAGASTGITIGSWIAGIGAAIGAVTGAIGGFTGGAGYGALGGGAFGLARGGNKIGREKQEYNRQVAMRTGRGPGGDAEIAGLQQGYMMGFQEGQQYVVAQLQKLQEDSIRQQMAGAKQEAPALEEKQGSFAAKHGNKCGSMTEKVTKDREAQAAASNQIA